MITYNSESWDSVKDSIELDGNLEWLAQRGFLHISTARERDVLKGYVVSIFSGTEPLAADFVESHNADDALMDIDKTYLQWHGVTKITRGGKTIWTN